MCKKMQDVTQMVYKINGGERMCLLGVEVYRWKIEKSVFNVSGKKYAFIKKQKTFYGRDFYLIIRIAK